jgi:5-methylthioadenosine/S-adenosylhomocysteine deaminase
MITHALDRHHWNEVTDGAVFQEDGVIAEIGSFAQLSRKHPDASVIGTGNEIERRQNLACENFRETRDLR